MTCSELEPWIQPFVDGEFTPADAVEVEQHLAHCPACDARIGRERNSRAALRSFLKANQPVTPASVRESVRSGISRERRRAIAVQLSRWGSVTLAMAAATSTVWTLRAKPEDSLRNAAVLRHAKRLPLEVQDPAQIETWFDGKLGHPVRLPRLTNATLSGARLSHVSDREAAYVSYEAATTPGGPSHRVGLFVLDATEGPSFPSGLSVSSAHGYNVATWQGEGVTYELVTDLDEAEIRRMVGAAPTPYAIQPAALIGH